MKHIGIAALLITGSILQQANGAASRAMMRVRPAQTVVIVADTPSRVAQYAARELVEHLEKASGIAIPVISESKDTGDVAVRIYVGETEAAKKTRIDIKSLAPDAFWLRTVPGKIFIVGREQSDADPLSEDNAFSGTLFGVYEFLERFAGVRWLWPGELGTFIPRQDSFQLPLNIDERIAPALRYRRLLWGTIRRSLRKYPPEYERLAFSPEGLQRYGQALQVHLRRHRMGMSATFPRVGHRFQKYWLKYGKEHPEWFAMRKDGGRGPAPDATGYDLEAVPMCVSNPELHRFIVQNDLKLKLRGDNIVSLGEVDAGGYCLCPDCMAWDGAQLEGEAADLFPGRMTSGRYARFAKEVYELASKQNPDVTVTMYLYMRYLHAPLTEISFPPQVSGTFVPWGPPIGVFYPTTEKRNEWLKEQWLGWAKTGMTMVYRPNHILAGYAMPHLNTWQGGAFFKFAFEHGMTGARFDSLTGQWAVRGPENYMYCRLMSDPNRSVAEIRHEYFEAFGPAATEAERYFDYWEEYNMSLLNDRQWRNMYRWPEHAPAQYPPEVFLPAEAILAEAERAATRRQGVAAPPAAEFAERVAFLRAGLEHARRSVELIRTLKVTDMDDPASFTTARKRLLELIEFRRAHEGMFIADYVWLARNESDARGPHATKIEALLASELPKSAQTP